MNESFDRIVGPDGVWRDDDMAHGMPSGPDARELPAKLNDRESYALRCLNAAANLYGVLEMDDFVRLYNGYAKDHAGIISDEMTRDELENLVDRLYLSEVEGLWFAAWGEGKSRVIVFYHLLELSDEIDGTPRTPEEQSARSAEEVRLVDSRVADAVASFKDVGLKILAEEKFLAFENPFYAERTENAVSLERFLVREYGLDDSEAEEDVSDILCNAREFGPKTQEALEFINAVCSWKPSSFPAFDRLAAMLAPALNDTRTWEGRGRTLSELYRIGLCEKCVSEDISDVFGIEGDGDDPEDEDDTFTADEIPESRYDGPIDFRFVKDPDRRDAKLLVYDDVCQVICEFAQKFVLGKNLDPEERKRAAVRLGFIGERDELEGLGEKLDYVVDDFASMMDDQDGEPSVCRALRRTDEFDEFERRAASYFANFRYTWMEVLAAKAGVGLKCRNLLTGEELFLMAPVVSRGEIKGMTICCGIAPMEDVYLTFGVIAPVRFDDPSAELKSVLTRLGLPTGLPISLTAADQARLAAETIRRLHSRGCRSSAVCD